MTTLRWNEIAERLSGSRHYWLHTTGANGTPNASPVWGVVRDGVLYHYTASRTLKARNLAQNPRVAVHLESASDVLIVQGDLRHLGNPGDHPEVLRSFEDKYRDASEVPFLPSSDPSFDVLYALEPERAIAWHLPDTEASTVRWSRSTG